MQVSKFFSKIWGKMAGLCEIPYQAHKSKKQEHTPCASLPCVAEKVTSCVLRDLAYAGSWDTGITVLLGDS